MRSRLLLVLVSVSMVLGACVYDPGYRGRVYGPRSHSHSRHGHAVELRFNPHLGVHVVVRHPHLYWHAGYFLLWHEHRWHRSDRHDGPWRRWSHDRVPRRLREYEQRGRGRGRGKGRR